MPKPILGGWGMSATYIKALLTLCSWPFGIWQFLISVVKQQSSGERPLWIVYFWHTVYAQTAIIGFCSLLPLYTFSVGFGVARSWLPSNARASKGGTSNSWLPRLFVSCRNSDRLFWWEDRTNVSAYEQGNARIFILWKTVSFYKVWVSTKDYR